MIPPRLSIAMTTYNGARFLLPQLESLFAQRRPPDELVISDDGSTDNTLTLAQQFAAQSPFPIKIHRNPTRLGIAGNFSQAIARTTGDVIFLCDQDDVWDPQKLATVAEVFTKQPEVGLVCHDAQVMDERMQPLGYTAWGSVGFTPAMQRAVNAGRAFPTFLAHCVIAGACLAFRSRYRESVLPLPAQMLAYDTWIVQVVSAQARCVALAQSLNLYRQHAAQRLGVPSASAWQWAAMAPTLSADSFLHNADYLRQLYNHLHSIPDRLHDPAYLRLVTTKTDFLQARARMRQHRRRRWFEILRQTAYLRYWRCGRGWRTLGRDILG